VNPAKLQQIEKKMASYLASDKNLKESAQRAFQAYLKSVFLMRNKSIFQVPVSIPKRCILITAAFCYWFEVLGCQVNFLDLFRCN
jgi:Domain of unknown function (DUF4217)